MELIEELFKIMNEQGWRPLMERFDEFCVPEIEWRGVALGRDAPGGDVVYRGRDGMQRFWEEIDAGRGSGVRLEQEMGFVHVFSGDRIARGENFVSHAEAKRAAEQMSADSVGSDASA